jgi:signal transduction histidine kinase
MSLHDSMTATSDERSLARRQLDSDCSALELRPVRVADVLRSIQASITPERGITVTLEVDESLHIAADDALLESAVAQLLHNALRFSHWGAHVVVRCRAEEPGVLIEVEDECGGLLDSDPVQLRSRSIEPADGGSNADSGLTRSKRAVEAMGGEMYVENYPGRGCMFALLFPPARPSRVTSRPPPSVRP